MRGLACTLAALAIGCWASAASADSVLLTLGFDHIVESGDGAAQLANGATGEAQFKVDVVSLTGSPNAVQFTVRNTGPTQSYIDGIYFDDGTLLGISSIVDGPYVDFEPGATPQNLSGGTTLTTPFVVTAGFFSADAEPNAANGINPGEFTNIIFTLQGTQTAQSVVDALLMDPSSTGSLRVGLKAQGFELGGANNSEAFVNIPPVVPVPMAAWGGMALFGLVATGRLRRHRGN